MLIYIYFIYILYFTISKKKLWDTGVKIGGKPLFDWLIPCPTLWHITRKSCGTTHATHPTKSPCLTS